MNPFPRKVIFPALRVDNSLLADERNMDSTSRWNIIQPDGKQMNIDPLVYEDVKKFDSPWLIININYIAFRIAAEMYKVESRQMPAAFKLNWYQEGVLEVSLKMEKMVTKLYCDSFDFCDET